MSDDIELLSCARDWLRAGHKVAMATVVRTWGSAPRGIGSHLVIRHDGLFEGSVSGGCVEGAVIAAAQSALETGEHQLLSFGVSDADAWDVGLACGGKIDVLVQPSVDVTIIEQLIDIVKHGESCTLESDLQTGRTSLCDFIAAETVQMDGVFIRLYQPKLRLAVVGAVHIAQALVPLAQQLGYDVLVIDPRTAFTTSKHFAHVNISNAWPDEALRDWGITSRTAVVTLTHDPKLDDPALETTLASSAFYIASLGSKKAHATRCDRLRAKGFNDSDVARIHGPAGLHIGAKSPAEIALSVMAQMTAVLRKVDLKK
jgi:xanthine dehydrogenase accessory factor